MFARCGLEGAQFEGAYLIGTRFLEAGETALRGAGFGDLERFRYIFVDRRKIEDLGEAAEWVRKVTSANQELRQPCPAAQQLRILFMKFIEVDGGGKRDELWAEDLVRGRRATGGPAPADCTEAARRFGYLTPAERPGRMRRAVGERYGDMVQFVSSLRVSDQLRELLNSLCHRTRCDHVPPAVR